MSARSTQRVVLVGAGRFGALHGRVWQEAGAELVGVCDLDPDRLLEVADRLGVGERGTDAAAMIARSRPDVVVVASDERSHAELALVALEAGAHVFVEKPLATSAAEAWEIHRAAAAAGREVVAGQISRFTTPFRRLSESVRAGRAGRVCALRLRRDFSRDWYASFGDRIHPVWESCIHDVDLAVALARDRVRRVTAVQSAAAGTAAPSVVSAQLEFRDGVIATIESAWLVPPAAPATVGGALELEGSIISEAEVLGLDGVLRHRLPGDGLVEWTAGGAAAPDLSLWPEVDGRVAGALRREVGYALAVFAGTRAPDLVPLEEVAWAVEATEAIERSLAGHCTIAIEES